MFVFGAIAEAMIKGNNIMISSYQHLHQLLFLTDWFREKVSYFSGTEQLWFVTTQLWMILLLTYFIKKHKDLYVSLLAPIFLIAGYTIVIRNSGNLNANLYVTINEKDIWFPLQFLRALAGLSCGTLVYTLYIKLKLYQYTHIAKKLGRVASVFILFWALWLSYRSKDLRVNSYNWRALLIVILYAAVILLAFLFGNDFKFEKNIFNRLFIFLGKCSLPVYMVHTLVIYVMKNTLEMNCLQKKYVVIFAVATIAMCVVFNFCIDLLLKIWRRILKWLKSVCIENIAE